MSVQTNPRNRKRAFPEVITGKHINDVLGEYTPDQAPFTATPSAFYSYHHGDIFYPGAPAWVLDQKTETPLMCIWGNGLMLRPNRGFQAFPPIAPLQTPANLVRVATPWGTFSPRWGPPINELSREAMDEAGFSLMPHYDFQAGAPAAAVAGSQADYGAQQGTAAKSKILPVGATEFGAYPLGVTSGAAFQDNAIFASDMSENSFLDAAGGSLGDY